MAKAPDDQVIVLGGRGRFGPPPTPTAQLELRGTEGAHHGKNRVDEPRPPVASNAKPDVELSPSAALQWDRYAPRLESMNVLTDVDIPALVRLCEVAALWADTLALVRSQSLKAELGVKGGLIERPEITRLIKLGDQVSRMEQQFGLTPASRTRVAAQPEKAGTGKKKKSRMMGGGL